MARGDKNYDKVVRKHNKGKTKAKARIAAIHNMVESMIQGDQESATDAFNLHMQLTSRDILNEGDHEMNDDDNDEDVNDTSSEYDDGDDDDEMSDDEMSDDDDSDDEMSDDDDDSDDEMSDDEMSDDDDGSTSDDVEVKIASRMDQ